MKILGFQKMTLLDFPRRVACTVFTGGCNFRCPFCHNAPLVTQINEKEISKDEIFSFLKKRVGILDGVCITGGEPLLNDEIFEFAREIKKMGYGIKLDTNGSFPDKLSAMLEEGLCDYVAMDIKNSREKYELTCGEKRVNVDDIDKSIKILLKGTVDFEFRTTVVKEFHTPEDIEKIAEWINPASKYFLQNFEDSGNLICGGLSAHSAETLEKMKNIASSFLPNVQIRGI